MAQTPTLYTERLILRPFNKCDAKDYAQVIFSDPDVMRYMNAIGTVPSHPLIHATRVIDRRQNEWKQRGYGAFAVIHHDTKVFMGHAGLYVIEQTTVVEIGYALGKAYWGQGYATEAARAILHFAFTETNLTEVVAVAFPENTASLRVMEKAGMRQVGETDQFYGLSLMCYKLSRSAYLATATTPKHNATPPDTPA